MLLTILPEQQAWNGTPGKLEGLGVFSRILLLWSAKKWDDDKLNNDNNREGFCGQVNLQNIRCKIHIFLSAGLLGSLSVLVWFEKGGPSGELKNFEFPEFVLPQNPISLSIY